jgi:hypothetical protein
VHDSAKSRARFFPHGDYKATVPHRNRHVGHLMMRLELGDETLEKLYELAL